MRRRANLFPRVNCRKGCCKFYYTRKPSHREWLEYNHHLYKAIRGGNRVGKAQRAGILLYNRRTNQVLLIQSLGSYWGVPKGKIEEGEELIETAQREFLEETGINFSNTFPDIVLNECKCYKINRINYIWYVPVQESPRPFPNDDATGACWIHLDCLDILKDIHGQTAINQLTRKLLRKTHGWTPDFEKRRREKHERKYEHKRESKHEHKHENKH